MKYLLLLLISANASADYRHPFKAPDSIGINSVSGVALSISMSQLNFSRATTKWQGSVGYGYYDNSNALSFGLGKKYKDVLINGSFGGSEDKVGFGVGVNWKW